VPGGAGRRRPGGGAAAAAVVLGRAPRPDAPAGRRHRAGPQRAGRAAAGRRLARPARRRAGGGGGNATLLLFTDGLFERRGSSLDQGRDRVRALLAVRAHPVPGRPAGVQPPPPGAPLRSGRPRRAPPRRSRPPPGRPTGSSSGR
jgi:hypothetical protein